MDFSVHVVLHYTSHLVVQVFVKTMVLVVTLGLIHGLILVPTFLCTLTSIYNAFFKDRLWGSQVRNEDAYVEIANTCVD